MRCGRDHKTDIVSVVKEDNMFLRKVSKHLPDKQKSPVSFVQIRRVRIRYSLRSETHGSITFYGIEVVAFSDDGKELEHVLLPELSTDRALCVRILGAMYRGTVTPCSAACVADDMLAQSVIKENLEGP